MWEACGNQWSARCSSAGKLFSGIHPLPASWTLPEIWVWGHHLNHLLLRATASSPQRQSHRLGIKVSPLHSPRSFRAAPVMIRRQNDLEMPSRIEAFLSQIYIKFLIKSLLSSSISTEFFSVPAILVKRVPHQNHLLRTLLLSAQASGWGGFLV